MVAVEAVVSQLLQKITGPLISLYDVDDKVKLLVIQFQGMQCFLKDADAKQEGNEGVKNWVRNVRGAAYEAEDVIDNFIFKVARLERTGIMGCITSFPEDYEFQTKDLIRLWTAEGLLEERGEQTFEEVGEDNLQELVRRSLVQVTSRRSSGRIKSCRIHDLLRDLSISKAREDEFLEVHRGNVNNRPHSGARRLAIHNNNLNQDPMATLEKLENLRILRLFGNAYWGKEMACTAKGFPRLEFLHLEELGQLEEWKVAKGALPSLLHLRIFNCQFLKMLPEGLQHVTTLEKLELQEMPAEFNKRLRKDEGEDWHKIRHIPSIDINEWSTWHEGSNWPLPIEFLTMQQLRDLLVEAWEAIGRHSARGLE